MKRYYSDLGDIIVMQVVILVLRSLHTSDHDRPSHFLWEKPDIIFIDFL